MQFHLPKRLFYSIAIVLAWFAFVVEGSHALFSTSAILAGNSLTTGTVGLEINSSQDAASGSFSDSQPGFTINLAPGASDTHFVTLRNVSATDSALDIDAFAILKDETPSSLTNATTVEFTPVDSNGASTGTGVKNSVAAFSSGHASLGVVINPGTSQRFSIKTALDSSFIPQNQSMTYDFRFTGTQHAQ